jgi:hypothetical protein
MTGHEYQRSALTKIAAHNVQKSALPATNVKR